MVAEPHVEVRELLEHVVARLGHDAVRLDDDEASVQTADAILMEPAFPPAVAFARRVRDALPHVPIVCVSILPRTADAMALAPVAYLLKPFSLVELETVLQVALATRAPVAAS